ncbi:MAG: DUF1566 domain-containing protein [Candidatus Ozemobacteraceae bacterium]
MRNWIILISVVISMAFGSWPGNAATPDAKYLKELQGERFTRLPDGIITDNKTGLEWKEGPNRPMDWFQTQAWIKDLGDGWRTPTRYELKGLYISTSPRKGPDHETSVKLDPAFKLNETYYVWSERGFSSNTAWFVLFQSGNDTCGPADVAGEGCRAFAVRSRK